MLPSHLCQSCSIFRALSKEVISFLFCFHNNAILYVISYVLQYMIMNILMFIAFLSYIVFSTVVFLILCIYIPLFYDLEPLCFVYILEDDEIIFLSIS